MSQRFRTRKHCSSCRVSFDVDSVHNCEQARIAAALERIATVLESFLRLSPTGDDSE